MESGGYTDLETATAKIHEPGESGLSAFDIGVAFSISQLIDHGMSQHISGADLFFATNIEPILSGKAVMRDEDREWIKNITLRYGEASKNPLAMVRNEEIAQYALRVFKQFSNDTIPKLDEDHLKTLKAILFNWVTFSVNVLKKNIPDNGKFPAEIEKFFIQSLKDLLRSKEFNFVMDMMQYKEDKPYKLALVNLFKKIAELYPHEYTSELAAYVQGYTGKSKNLYRANNTAFRYGFGAIKELDPTSANTIINPELPTVVIIGTSDDSYSRLRALGKTGKVNAVCILSSHDLDEKWLVYAATGKRSIVFKRGIAWTAEGLAYDCNSTGPIDYIEGGSHRAQEDMCLRYGIPTPQLPHFDDYEDKRVGLGLLREHMPEYLPQEGIIETPTMTDEKIAQAVAAISAETIVVKPTNESQGRGVAFFDRTDINGMREHMTLVGANRKCTEFILQEFLSCVPLNVSYQSALNPSQMATVAYDWNIRCFVTSNERGECVADGMVVRYGTPGLPINLSTGARELDIESALTSLGISPEEQHALLLKTQQLATTATQCVVNKRRSLDPRLTAYSQDMAGIDIIIVRQNNQLTPRLLEINGANSGGMYNLDAISEPENFGKAIRLTVERVIQRARDHFDRRTSTPANTHDISARASAVI